MKEILVITVVGLLSLLIGYSLAGFVVLSLFYNILDSTITWMPFVKITICGALAIAGIMGLVGFHGYLFKKAKMSSAGPGGKATFDSAISELDFSQEWFEHIETWIKLSKSKTLKFPKSEVSIPLPSHLSGVKNDVIIEKSLIPLL